MVRDILCTTPRLSVELVEGPLLKTLNLAFRISAEHQPALLKYKFSYKLKIIKYISVCISRLPTQYTMFIVFICPFYCRFLRYFNVLFLCLNLIIKYKYNWKWNWCDGCDLLQLRLKLLLDDCVFLVIIWFQITFRYLYNLFVFIINIFNTDYLDSVYLCK